MLEEFKDKYSLKGRGKIEKPPDRIGTDVGRKIVVQTSDIHLRFVEIIKRRWRRVSGHQLRPKLLAISRTGSV